MALAGDDGVVAAEGRGAEGPPSSPRIGAVLPAAGSGTRMGGVRKPYLDLAGEPVLGRALRPFLSRPDVVAVTVALPAKEAANPPAWLMTLDPRITAVAGGESRGASVRAALHALPGEVDVVVIHDGSRPLLSDALLSRCIEVASSGEGAVAGWPAVDTLKETDEGGRVRSTPDRRAFWHAQTPRPFPGR